ncbi:MAG: DNA translocase FtsK 4TM domain-containing protein, partial [Eubacterium sp.]|nr:DNA translocase FtsK 4TM domain-containing protein [Eubacterium sp.]
MAKKRSSSTPDNSGNPAASFTNEVILWAVLAVSIILFISNFGIAGAVGNFISSIFFGLFGLTAYIFPILLFAGTAFIIANQENKKAIRKAAAAGVFFVFVCMFLELISGSVDTTSPLGSYVWSSGSKSGGGLLGGLLTWLIRPHLGTVSAYVIDIIMMIICIVLVTQRSLWKPIQSGSRKMYDSAKKETIRQRQQYNERRQRRVDNKVTGVSTDTSLKNASAPGASDNISEIRPDPALLQDFPIYMMNQPMPKQKEASVRQTMPQQQEKPQLQQGLAAVGMGYGEVLPFHENIRPTASKKADSDVEAFDKIIPITNRKVALQPNAGQLDTDSQAAQAPSEVGSAADMASSTGTEQTEEPDDFLLKTGDLFSELLPGGTDTELSADEPPQPFGALDTGQTDDNALWDFAGEALAGLGAEAAVLDEEPEPEEMPELPPVSAQELIAQQLQAAAPAPKRVTAVAPVSEDPAAQPAAGGLSKPSNAAASGSASIRRQPKQSAAQAAG